MCCCGQPTINGQVGFRWNDPKAAPGIHPVNPPALQEGDVLTFDEPGRCGGMDSHSHHFRVVLAKHGTPTLLVRHGGGDERLRVSRTFYNSLERLDSNQRYWILRELHGAFREGEQNAREAVTATWRKAAAEKRIRTRRLPAQGLIKVWIETKGAETVGR